VALVRVPFYFINIWLITDRHRYWTYLYYFDHSSTTPRATRWREWVVNLRYAFGSAYPLLANQTSEVLDTLDHWWGLTWSPLLDLDNITQEQEQKLNVDFQKA